MGLGFYCLLICWPATGGPWLHSPMLPNLNFLICKMKGVLSTLGLLWILMIMTVINKSQAHGKHRINDNCYWGIEQWSDLPKVTWVTLEPDCGPFTSQFNASKMVLPPWYLPHWIHPISWRCQGKRFQLCHTGCKCSMLYAQIWRGSKPTLKLPMRAAREEHFYLIISSLETRFGWERLMHVVWTCQWMSQQGLLEDCGTGAESPAQVGMGEISWNFLLEKAQVLCWVIYEYHWISPLSLHNRK